MVEQLTKLKDNKTVLFELKKLIAKIVSSEFGIDVSTDEVEINTTGEAKFGDYTTNISLKISKLAGKNPREIAEIISKKLVHEAIEKIEIAGPGFLNLTLKSDFYLNQLDEVLAQKDTYGKWSLSADQVMVEFGQPNTHKAFHVGHLKSAITGLSLSRLIKNLGFDVIQANFYGDIGMHVAKSVWGYMQKGLPEGFNLLDPHQKMKYIDGCYVYGAKMFKEDPESESSIKEVNNTIYKLIFKKDIEPTERENQIFTTYLQTLEWSIEHQNEAFKKLGIIYERQFPESEIAEHGVELVKSHIGDIFKEDAGAIIFPGDDYGLNRWVFISSEGNPTYSAKDLGLAYKKFSEFPKLAFNITTTSVEQNAYFQGVIKALELINSKFIGRDYHVGFGWLLREDGKKISSRMGDSIKGMDIIGEAIEYSQKKVAEGKNYTEDESKLISEKVAIAGLKFLVLSRELHKDISYNPEQFLNPEGFSGPYILYGYVRAKSILRQSESTEIANIKSEQSELILNEAELSLAKLISKFPLITLDAGRTLSPHTLANYLFELTQAFNSFYRENKVLVEDEKVRSFRLKLTEAVSIVLKNGLTLLGIETIEQM